MKFLRLTDIDDKRHAINIDQIIELREDDNLHTVIVTAKENITYPLNIDESINMIEKFKANLKGRL